MTSVLARATRAWAPGPGLLLAAIVAVGALLRFWGIVHGLPEGFIYHPDAGIAVGAAWQHYLGAPWRGALFGVAYHALLSGAMWTVDAVGRFLGYPVPWSFEAVATTASLLGAALGTATVAAAYWLGARAYGPAAGLLAAAFLAVDPLHTFQSHYPYRDVPMTAFLTLALVGCVAIADRPTPLAFVLTGVAAAATAALKPAGFVVAAPLVVAWVIAAVRLRRLWLLLGAVALFGAALLSLPWFTGGGWGSPFAAAWDFATFVLDYFLRRGAFRQMDQPLWPGMTRSFGLLVEWLGLPLAGASVLAVAYGIGRRRASDLVLAGFLLPALVATALNVYLDERFLVFLLPAGAVMLGRAVGDAWAGAARFRLARAVVAVALAGLLGSALLQSAWQGILLTLPDTRALAGKWLEAHLPRTTRVAIEGYPPLGVSGWPNAVFFDPQRPFRSEAARAEILVTSSLHHRRYFVVPRRHSPEIPAFFDALRREAQPIKSFALVPLGFIHSTIEIYATDPPPRGPLVRPSLPRPYDTRWNGGVSFLEPGPYDRDDRTIRLTGSAIHTAVLVSRAPPDEVAVFVWNERRPSRVRVRVGWTSRTRTLEPGALEVLRFHPRWLGPWRPALHRFEVGLLPPGAEALIQLRHGAREIGETYAHWDRWDAALPYLERAAGADPPDAEAHLWLATTYERLGRVADARRAIERALARDPGLVDRYLQLGRDDSSAEAWGRAFRDATGLEPSRLTFALGQALEAEALPVEAGRLLGDPAASGGLTVTFEKGRDRPGVVVNGPPMTLYLARGAYHARFALRAWDAPRSAAVAVLKVFAEERLLASRRITAAELAEGQPFAEVAVPFTHTAPSVRVAVEVEATGLASLAVDRIRIEPDLREAFRQRARTLAALTGASAR